MMATGSCPSFGSGRIPGKPLPTVVIENVYPALDCGRFPVKREVGQQFEVWADIFAEGHGVIAAVLKYREETEISWRETAMEFYDNDRWRGRFHLERNTRYRYTIEAYAARFESWKRDLGKRIEAGEDVSGELLEGGRMVEQTLGRARGDDRAALQGALDQLAAAASQARAAQALLEPALGDVMARWADRAGATVYQPELQVVADREKARFASWYEMFHRSQGNVPGQSATWTDCEARLADVRAMGFDVVYLPPVHPIGISGRKGRNNSLELRPGDPGSPWAIGNQFGGHKAINPELGTLEEFDHFVATARDMDIEIALDYAVQCSPDHPYVREHPEWFYHRPDGSIRYAENPPKKYQDIYPLNMLCDDYQALWEELKSIILFWIEHGVRIFRVDNPHTKPFLFWEWLIHEVQRERPDVIFLAEAFTRPKIMKLLAKAGFTQSYTYFTWRNSKHEMTEYLTELTQTDVREYLRGNLFANTPDILPEILQQGGQPAFKLRLVLAATLSSAYGIYNGFELCEGGAVPGTEEYQDSEKYEYKVWDWDRPGNIKRFIAVVNQARKQNPALQGYENLRFHRADDDNILLYGKTTESGDNVVFVAVNLDPFQAHGALLHLPLAELGLPDEQPYRVREAITDQAFTWVGPQQYVELDPHKEPAAIFVVEDTRRS